MLLPEGLLRETSLCQKEHCQIGWLFKVEPAVSRSNDLLTDIEALEIKTSNYRGSQIKLNLLCKKKLELRKPPLPHLVMAKCAHNCNDDGVGLPDSHRQQIQHYNSP